MHHDDDHDHHHHSHIIIAQDQITPAQGYAGNIPPKMAWEWVNTKGAILVDVRTTAELTWVGYIPGSKHIPYKEWPDMEMTPDFEVTLRQVAPDTTQPVLFICRADVRGIAAARYATEIGYTQAYNVSGGFEGGLNEANQRNKRAGWRFCDLPWRQK